MLGEREKAAELYPAIVAATRTGTLVSHVGHRLLETVAGIAAACGRQWEQGETHYQRALDQASDIPFKSEQPEVRRFYAQMLIERDAPGDRDKARQLLEEAIVSYREMGMPKHLEMAEELLRECA